MPENREPLNPFESPRTVAGGEPVGEVREESSKTRDLRHQTVGFIALWLIAALLAILSAFSFALSQRIPDKPAWDWFHSFLTGFGFIIGVIAAIGFIACSPWILISAGRWLIERGSGYFVRSKDAN